MAVVTYVSSCRPTYCRTRRGTEGRLDSDPRPSSFVRNQETTRIRRRIRVVSWFLTKLDGRGSESKRPSVPRLVRQYVGLQEDTYVTTATDSRQDECQVAVDYLTTRQAGLNPQFPGLPETKRPLGQDVVRRRALEGVEGWDFRSLM